jgi:hypothetical protein
MVASSFCNIISSRAFATITIATAIWVGEPYRPNGLPSFKGCPSNHALSKIDLTPDCVSDNLFAQHDRD